MLHVVRSTHVDHPNDGGRLDRGHRDPTRLAIIRVLAAGDKNVTELAKALREEIVNISHHLSVLRAAHLARETRDGRFRVYSLIGAEAKGTSVELSHESGVRVSIPLV